jgi:hypothetical protein
MIWEEFMPKTLRTPKLSAALKANIARRKVKKPAPMQQKKPVSTLASTLPATRREG